MNSLALPQVYKSSSVRPCGPWGPWALTGHGDLLGPWRPMGPMETHGAHGAHVRTHVRAFVWETAFHGKT